MIGLSRPARDRGALDKASTAVPQAFQEYPKWVAGVVVQNAAEERVIRESLAAAAAVEGDPDSLRETGTHESEQDCADQAANCPALAGARRALLALVKLGAPPDAAPSEPVVPALPIASPGRHTGPGAASAVERMRAARQRKREGSVLFQTLITGADAEKLVALRLLEAEQKRDPAAVRTAAQWLFRAALTPEAPDMKAAGSDDARNVAPARPASSAADGTP